MNDNHETLFESEWLAVKKTADGYEYASEVKGDGQGVAVVAYRSNPFRVVGRFEVCPPHGDGEALCSLTGTVDKGEKPLNAAVRELFEEAGIQAGYDEMVKLGAVRPSKATDYLITMFAVDIGNERDIGRGPGDGTKHEEEAYCQWVDYESALVSKDPVLTAAVARLKHRLEGGRPVS